MNLIHRRVHSIVVRFENHCNICDNIVDNSRLTCGLEVVHMPGSNKET